jgi:hypothetical protein
MTRIAKKSRVVKGKKKKKSPKTAQKEVSKKPLRYTIRKDSLDRRYAIDKHTGKRVSVLKAEQERTKRTKQGKKPKEIFRGITVPKPKKSKSTHKKRSEAAKKGWETRRAKRIPIQPITFEGRPPSFAEQEGALIPEGMRIHVLGGVADRAEIYPKVADAADFSWINLQVEAATRRKALNEGREPPPIITPRFDRFYGQGQGEEIRANYYAYARNLLDLDQIVESLNEDQDYDLRELYTLYFSPELA